MRALKMLLLTTAMVIVCSCSKEENEHEIDHSMLLGEWNLTEFSYSGTSSLTDGGETSSLSYSAEAVDMDARVKFVDETNYTTAGRYTITLTTTMDGEIIVQQYPFSDITGSGTYKIEGNRMISQPQSSAYQDEMQLMNSSEVIIRELTSSRMVLVMEMHTVAEEEGMQAEITLDMIQILTR